MPVNGPGGPTGPRPLSPSNAPSGPSTPAAPSAPAAPVSRGWTAPSGAGAQPASDGFGTLATRPSTTVAGPPSAVELQVKGAINTFNSKVEVTLHHDAMSLARGQTPTREGDQLTAQQ